MEDIFFIPLTALLGLVVGFTAPMTGAGGVVSTPALILMGMPPHVALASSRFGAATLWGAAFKKLNTSDKVLKPYVLPLAIVAAGGGYLGALIAVDLPADILEKAIGVITIIIVALISFQGDAGVVHRVTSQISKAFGYITYFFVSIYGGFFGAGAGALSTITFIRFFGWTFTETKGTEAIAKIVRVFVSLVPFFLAGQIDYLVAVTYGTGTAIGGYWGTHTMIRIGDKWVKRVFIVASIAMAVKLLFDNI